MSVVYCCTCWVNFSEESLDKKIVEFLLGNDTASTDHGAYFGELSFKMTEYRNALVKSTSSHASGEEPD